jgi:hypothetical protein
MELPDGTTLMHGPAPYDPVKAREYYLRNRKLKGRKKGITPPPKGNSPRSSNSVTVKVDGKAYKLSPQQLAEQKAYAAKRVLGIKKKLTQLNAELKKMAEAKKSEKEAKKPDSAAEKSDKAKDSEKYRDKNKQALKNKSKQAASKEKSAKKPDTDSVEGLKKTIEGAQKNLKAALNRQRALSTATKG